MKFNRKELLKFYDERVNDEGRGGDVSGITGLWGEDLILGLLRHFWRHEESCESKIVTYSCKSGKGPKLDAWIEKTPRKGKNALFQTEVKNWSAWSIDDGTLELGALKLRAYSEWWWKYFFEQKRLPARVAKVLKQMMRPKGCVNQVVTPLLCMWPYMVGKHGKPYIVGSRGSKQLHVFSGSAYLRSLTSKYIEIEMPRTQRRLALMKELAEF